MCPIAHVPHHPCPHLDLWIIMAMCPITPIPITLPLILMYPIAHVPYCPCTPLLYPHVDLEGGHATFPICPITPVPMSNWAHRWFGSKMSNDVKLSKRCLLSKNQIPGLWKVHKKINWHNEVCTYWHQFWYHIWW